MPIDEPSPMERSGTASFRRDAPRIVAVALSYFVIARLSLHFIVQPDGIAAIWPPSGIFLSTLLLARKAVRPWYAGALLATDFVAEILAGTPPVVSALYAAALTADAALSVWLLHRFVGEHITLTRVREVIGWLLLSVIFSNALLSLVAASAAQLLPESDHFWSAWQWWAASDGVGNLLVTPMVLTWELWLRNRGGNHSRNRLIEEAVLFLGSGLAAWMLFRGLTGTAVFILALPYLSFPFLLWAALRSGVRGVATVMIILAVIAVPFVAAGLVPSFSFAPGKLDEIMVVQFVLAISAIPTLILGAVVMERRRSREAEAASAQEVRRNRAILQSVIDGTTDAAFVKDTRGRYLMINEAACRFVGKSAELLLGNDDTALFPFAEAQAVMEHDRSIMASGVTQTGEEVVTVEGSPHPHTFLSTKGPVRDKWGDVIGLFGISRDITERKLMEEALRESEYFFRESQRAADIGSYQLDILAGVWKSSEVLDQIFGIGEEYPHTIPGWLELVHPEDRAMMHSYLEEEVLGHGRDFNKEYRIVRVSDGETRWVHGQSQFVFDTSGAIIGMMGTLRDITERRRSEDAIRESELRLSDIMTSMGDWVWEVDANGVYTYSSPQGTALFGDVIGRTPFDLMHPAEAERVKAIFLDIVSRKAPIRNLGNWNVTKDGEEIYLLTNGVPIVDAEGRLHGYRGVDKDITERERAERERARLDAQLQQMQKIESVGRLAGGVAHDFNNMLAVILGNAEEVLDQLDPTDPIHSDVEEIRRAAVRSAALTRQLLAFARRQTIEPKVLDLNETVAGMLKMMRRLIGEDIHLTWQPKRDLWPVKIDPSQVDQILANLCANARDAISGVGNLVIETEHAGLSEADCAAFPDAEPGEYVVLMVSDNGTGIDEKTLVSLFEPFFTTKEMGEGTGLGLATVYGIVKQNNGFIDVRSKPGHGTTFRIYLPRYSGAVSPVPNAAARETVPRGRETILLAEDEPGVRRLAARVMEGQGYTVLTAGTPGEALHIAREYTGEIHLLVSDVVMPEMNGLELARNLRVIYPNLKALFMSGYTTDVIAHHGVLDDSVQFVQKPFTSHDFVAKVRKAMDQGRNTPAD